MLKIRKLLRTINSELPRRVSTNKCMTRTGVPHPPRDTVAKECHPDLIPPRNFDFTIFRRVNDWPVIPGVGKDECYQNPEYFAYHQYSFYKIFTKLREMKDSEEKRKDHGKCK